MTVLPSPSLPTAQVVVFIVTRGQRESADPYDPAEALCRMTSSRKSRAVHHRVAIAGPAPEVGAKRPRFTDGRKNFSNLM
jgi:hypothetical protein